MENKYLRFLILFSVYCLFSINNKTEAQVVCNHCTIASPINNGLVACYPFSGNTLDQSGFNNHGTNYGATLTTDRFGNPNSAYSFNGVNNYISVPNSASLTSPLNNLTLLFWVNITAWSPYFTQNYASVISKSNSATDCQYRATLSDLGISQINNLNFWTISSTTNNLNQWYFFAVVINGTNLKLYRNGILIDQNSSPATFPFNNVNSLNIGKDDPGFTDYFSGKIDDIRIYNRTLNLTEINEIFNYQPVIKANAGADKSICVGDSVQLIASGGEKYKWNNSLFISNDSIPNPYTRTNMTKDYIVTVSSGLCFDRDTIKVTINSKPVVSTNQVGIICAGDNVQLNAFGANKYIWNNGIYLNSDTISNPIAKPITNTSFIVQGFNGNCSDKDTINVNVIVPNPDAGLNQIICIGDSVQLNASGGTQYEWLSNNTLSDTSIYNPIAKPNVTTKYYVLVTNGTCKQKIDSVEIKINDNFTVSAGNDINLCKYDSIQLLGVGGTSFNWIPSIGLSQNNIPNPIAKPIVSTQYILKSNSGNCVSEDTIIITVNEKPIIDVGLDKVICKGETFQINALSDADLFTWNPPVYLNNTSIKNPTSKPDSNISYVLKAENSTNTCISYDTLNISVSSPRAGFISLPKSGVKPLIVSFNNLSIPNKMNYLWDFGNQENSILLNPKTTFTKIGKYKVSLIVSDSNNCRDTANDEIIVNDNLNINIPNVFTPNNDNLNDFFEVVLSDLTQIKEIKGTIWNRWGGLIYEFNYPNENWWNGKSNNLDCQDGVYFYILNIKTTYEQTFEYHGTVTLIR